MSSLTSIEKRYFNDLFAMGSGYVISQEAYNNTTFAEFFRECVKVHIDDAKYAFNGTAKAKRLRAFWEIESDQITGKVLEALLEVWGYENPDPDTKSKEGYNKAKKAIARLLGKDQVREKTESEQ